MAKGFGVMLAKLATRQGKLHKPARNADGAEAPAIDARPGCAREAPQRGQAAAATGRSDTPPPQTPSRARYRTIPPFGMARLDHRTRKIDTIGAATGESAAVTVLALRGAFHSRAGQRLKIGAGSVGITLDTLPPLSAMIW